MSTQYRCEFCNRISGFSQDGLCEYCCKKINKEQKPRVYFWVPEDKMYECASDCLGENPDDGPACLVANHVHYDEAIKLLRLCEEALYKYAFRTEPRIQSTFEARNAYDAIRESGLLNK